MLNQNGAFNFAAVAEFDAAVAALCREGLEMEVLSWKIYIDEPGACSEISQALNSGYEMALKATELTTLAVLSGAVALAYESAVAENIAFETVREKVRNESEHFVDLPEFLDLFEFVINMSAHRGPFIRQLLHFGALYVDGKKRQLRLNAFATANKIDLDFPRCKIAMLMRAYRKPPSYGWCPSPEALWTRKERRAPN